MYVEDIVQYAKRRHEQLKSDRSNFEEMWEDIARFIIPERGGFQHSFVKGERVRRYILDSSGAWANEQLVNFLYSSITNPASDWFALGVYDPNLARREDVRQYLSLANQHMYAIFNNPRKKFYNNSHELYSDIVPFGTGTMFLEDRPGSGLHFRSWPLLEVYLDEDMDSNVDVFTREFKFSLRQIVQQFGEKNLTDDMIRCLHKEPDRKFDVLHAVFPKDESGISSMSNNRMPYASVYILCEKNIKLRESGFRRFPLMAPRWSKRNDEIYGRGPGAMALAEIRMIQKMKETTLKGGQKIVDPPMQVPDNTFLSPLNQTPGAVNYYNPLFDGEGAKPLVTDSRPDFGVEMMDREKEAIFRNFYVDKLSSQKNPNIEQTRTEFLGDQQERMMLMAPQLGRMHAEYLGPAIEQAYFVEVVTNRLPPAPDVLRGQPLVVQYKSPLARAQQMQRLQQVTGAVQDIVPFAQAFPDIVDPINSDAIAQWIFMSHDAPAEIIRPEDEVARIREQRQQAQQLQQMAETAKTGSEAVRNLSQAEGGGQRVSR